LTDPNPKRIGSIVEKIVKGKKETRSGHLTDSLDLQEREMISLVGAGGKTTLMFCLAKELVLQGKKVITTTTTKILEPSSEETSRLVVNSDEKEVQHLVAIHLGRDRHLTVARERLGSGKLRGVAPEVAANLWDSTGADTVIVEADGAAGRPVKAPREHEPVIPSNTTLVIALLGLDGIDQQLNDENAFQPELISRITGVRVGEKMTGPLLAILMTHREGILKGAPAGSRVVSFINKIDLPGGLEKGRTLAREILNRKHPQIERIVLGQLKHDPPVAEVFLVSEKRG
jgi:probable selenium-dependent hydroxylase accessory protein YqeC